jgi:hypothetical protein
MTLLAEEQDKRSGGTCSEQASSTVPRGARSTGAVSLPVHTSQTLKEKKGGYARAQLQYWARFSVVHHGHIVEGLYHPILTSIVLFLQTTVLLYV